ncbi:MAG: cystathionine gamma-synthase [Kiritimatiellae bacterium]|nr:cystathionine gamma-synthase [Kiritimatiellia bacterium]
MRFETLAIHAGQDPDRLTGAVTVPVYQTSTFQQDGIGRPRGYEYSRTGNPTRTALETALAAVEGGGGAAAFASGVAATAAVLHLLRPGDHVVAADDLYGGTYRLFERYFRPWGLRFDYVTATEPEAYRRAMRPETRLIWIETPTNPLLRLVDIAAVAQVAHEHGAHLAVDSTFATPCLQRPLELGADLVVHSTTKYIGGHSDLIGGAVIWSDAELGRRLRLYQNAFGAVPGPWDCWLVLRGLKTLSVRMAAHCRGARRVAEWLRGQPAVERVLYPGLEDHPQAELVRRQMGGAGGGMVSFELAGGFAAVERLVSRLKLFVLAESLGGVESLVCHPARMTHASIPPSERRARGIGDNLVRLSVGLEHPDDLIADLAQGLQPDCAPAASKGD